jgi:uncharacterized protein (DUF1499 family)
MCSLLLRPIAALLPLNDYSTDDADPPALARRGAPAKPRGAALMRALNPLKPLALLLASPAAALDAAAAVARRTPGFTVETEDRAAGVLQGVATTRLVRFKDDFTVRVRPAPGGGGGSVVDMRSRSRVGLSDLGANAARIRAFLAAVAKEAARAATAPAPAAETVE